MPSHKLACPEGVLHARISDVHHAVTVETIRHLFHRSGDGYVICAFEQVVDGMYGVEVYVEFRSRWTAARARDALDGHAIYDGCCILAVDLVPPIYTTITTPDHNELAPAHFYDDTPYAEWAAALAVAERHDMAPSPSDGLQTVSEIEESTASPGGDTSAAAVTAPTVPAPTAMHDDDGLTTATSIPGVVATLAVAILAPDAAAPFVLEDDLQLELSTGASGAPLSTAICETDPMVETHTTCSTICLRRDISALVASMMASMVLSEADVTTTCMACDSCVYPVAHPVAMSATLVKSEGADTAVMHEDEQLLVAGSDMADNHILVTGMSAMPLTLVALGVDGGHVANTFEVLLPLKPLAPFAGSKELYGSPLLPQFTQAMVAWGSCVNRLPTNSSGMWSGLGCAPTHSVCLLPWDPGDKTGVLIDSGCSKDIAWGACVKQLDVDLSGNHDHHHQKSGLPKNQVLCKVGTLTVSEGWSLAIERKPWPPPHSVQGYVPAQEQNSWFDSGVEMFLCGTNYSLTSCVGCHTTGTCLKSKNMGLTVGKDASCGANKLSLMFSIPVHGCELIYGFHHEQLWDPGGFYFSAWNCQWWIVLVYCKSRLRRVHSTLQWSTLQVNCLSTSMHFQWRFAMQKDICSSGFSWFQYCSFERLQARQYSAVLLQCIAVLSSAGSTCVCNGIVTITSRQHFNLGVLPLVHCKDLSFQRFLCVDQMMLKTGHVIPCSLELVQWKIAWSLSLQYFDVVNLSKQLISAAAPTALCSPWDPGIWALLCVYRFSAQKEATKRIKDYYFDFFLEQVFYGCYNNLIQVYFDYGSRCDLREVKQHHVLWDPGGLARRNFLEKVSAVYYLNLAKVCLDYSIHRNLGEVMKHQVQWDPGGSRWLRLEVKPKLKEGGMLATIPYYTVGWTMLYFYWAWAYREPQEASATYTRGRLLEDAAWNGTASAPSASVSSSFLLVPLLLPL